MKSSLYELQEIEYQLYDALEIVTDDEARQIILDSLTVNNEQIEVKLENYARMIRNKAAEEKMCREEAKHFSARASACESLVKRLKAGIQMYLASVNATERKAGPFRLKVWSNPPSLVYPEDATQLPEKYQKTIVVADTAAIKADLEAGIEIPDCSIGRGQHVRVL